MKAHTEVLCHYGMKLIDYGWKDTVGYLYFSAIDLELEDGFEDMFETMYAAHGIGLAAPQIGMPVRLFIVDATPFEDDEDLSEEERKYLVLGHSADELRGTGGFVSSVWLITIKDGALKMIDYYDTVEIYELV